MANEIKELAKQTADSTRQISPQIQDIQKSAEGPEEQVEDISSVIHKVDQIMGSIAASIEEQSSAARKIAGSVAHACSGKSEVNSAMAGSAGCMAGMFDQVTGKIGATAEVSCRCSQSSLNAENLAAIARQIVKLVGQFRLRSPKFSMGRVKGAHLN